MIHPKNILYSGRMVAHGTDRLRPVGRAAHRVRPRAVPVSRLWRERPGRPDGERRTLRELSGAVTRPMSTAERPVSDPPEFELEGRYDDPDDPSELTVFTPGRRRFATEWLTADRSAVVPLDRMR